MARTGMFVEFTWKDLNTKSDWGMSDMTKTDESQKTEMEKHVEQSLA